MPQYRVELQIRRTEFIDGMAENEADAKYGAVIAFGGTDQNEVIALSAKLVAGQNVEPEVAKTPGKYDVLVATTFADEARRCDESAAKSKAVYDAWLNRRSPRAVLQGDEA